MPAPSESDARTPEAVDAKIAALRSLVRQLVAELAHVPEARRPEVFDGGPLMQQLLHAIAPVFEEGSPYTFLLDHRTVMEFMARVTRVLTMRYSIPCEVDGQRAFLSPAPMNWFDDGVMILQGRSPHEGTICRWVDGQLLFGISSRHIVDGAVLGPGDFTFVPLDVARAQLAAIAKANRKPEGAITELEELLASPTSKEAAFQSYFERWPWVLGMRHREIRPHETIDGGEIPDYVGTRSKDSEHDLFEIKDPSLKLFRQDGELNAEFHGAWHQAEKYVAHAVDRRLHLQETYGFRFASPMCFLIAGYRLSKAQREKIRLKERQNRAIEFLTYDEVLAMARSTVETLRSLLSEAPGPDGVIISPQLRELLDRASGPEASASA